MKKFKFKLDSILKYRNVLNDQAKDELASAIKDGSQKQEELRHVAEMEYSNKQKFKQECQTKGCMDIRAMLDRLSYIAHLNRQRRQKTQELRECEHKIDARRDQYIKRNKDKQVLEKFEQRKKDQHQAYVTREEQNLIDESGAGGCQRKKSENKG